MRLGRLAVVLGLACAVLRRPGLEERAANCPLNSCFQKASSAHTTASQDCVSFFRAVVTPCPATSTRLTTTTVRALSTQVVTTTVTATVVATVLTTQVTTDLETVVITTAVTPTTVTAATTETDPDNTAYMTSCNTVLVSTTEVVTEVVGTTVVPSDVGPPQRRDVEARAACTPTTSYAMHLPTYATSCGATAGNYVYSSVCACVSATHSMSTLARQTSTVASTVTQTTTPISTATATQMADGGMITAAVDGGTTTIDTTAAATVTETATDETTIEVTETFTVNLYNTIVTTVATTMIDVEATSTVVACPIQQVEGPLAGQYLFANASQADYMFWTADPSAAQDFYLGGQGHLFQDALQVQTEDTSASYVILQTGQYTGLLKNYGPPTCMVNADSTLSCVGYQGRNNLFVTILNYGGAAISPDVFLASQSDVATHSSWIPVTV